MTQERARSAGGSRPLRDQRRRDPGAGQAGRASSKTITRRSGAARRPWTSNGPRTDSPANCSSSRPARKPSSRRCTPQNLEVYDLKQRGEVLVTGRSVGERDRPGDRPRHPRRCSSCERFREGEVLVTDKTDPDWEPTMKKAAAIVTNRGGRTCHAAIVSRELGMPAIVGTEQATEVLRDGQPVTVACSEGETGHVYAGLLPFDVRKVGL